MNSKLKPKLGSIFQVFLALLTNISNTKALTALKDGFVLTMPVTLIGSVFLLIANLPISGYSEFMKSKFGTNWAIGLNQVSGATFDVLAIISVISIAYFYAKNENEDGISCSILALTSFITVTASTVNTKSGESVGSVINKAWTGGQGIITAIIIGLLSGMVFCFFVKRKITIRMPEGVPVGVSNAFIAVIPGVVIILLSMIVFYIFQFSETTLTEWIFKTIQTPMQKLTNTYFGGVVMVFLCAILFWAGLHGPNIVMGPILPIITANSIANSELLSKGNLSVAGGAYIVTPQVLDYFVKIGGTGITIGLIIAAIMRARSKQMKDISKLALIPGIFNINEPIIFGLPIVYNPIMLLPFIIVPILTFTLVYICIYIGFLDPFTAVQVPWTMPPIISGFILQGFRGAFVQVVIIIMSTLIYYPFMKSQDNICIANENKH
ncbi:PTS sugar transporter subunit IIC [Clostridium botulinum]|uniref:Permease IIC component n=1 Tax=Clostridium botulinum CFSAN001627 TaxID=1232189 RepID=M1ZV15_CLOBO|nr:PTS sugar transporter subunit IIC [Clostridium botulinum]EKN40485.1 PTS system cellobiose-specific transporter subunit IIC [Clostridium botulinum CFSAN001627]APC84701.1 PTS system, lactose/cellobiose IIC component family protein [Clostridium botulinum]AXG96403.1 PTS sugar transporter subunit IIC [Clostridium botulinum]EDT82639.1 lichenan permease iic component [Clostridium botulinum NCTC 2916]MBY6772468.1 PTS sugar transporter subunit IIC [Clostridium botulinum]